MRAARTPNSTAGAEANSKVCLNAVGDFSMSPIQRLSARSEAQRKPWLASKEWRERRIVSSHGVRGFFFALALAGFGLPAIITIAIGIWGVVEGHPDGVVFLVLGAFYAGGLAVARYQWGTWRKFGQSVCHLETLPGVIGDWFKASVEVKLPIETRPAVLVRLENFKMVGECRETVWEISERVFTANLPRIQGDRYLVPVRFQIPARKDYYAKADWLPWKTGGGWLLEITAEVPGVDLHAAFRVPIFETDEAPAEEQIDGWGIRS